MYTTVVERINVRNGLRLYTCIGMMDDKDVCRVTHFEVRTCNYDRNNLRL